MPSLALTLRNDTSADIRLRMVSVRNASGMITDVSVLSMQCSRLCPVRMNPQVPEEARRHEGGHPFPHVGRREAGMTRPEG